MYTSRQPSPPGGVSGLPQAHLTTMMKGVGARLVLSATSLSTEGEEDVYLGYTSALSTCDRFGGVEGVSSVNSRIDVSGSVGSIGVGVSSGGVSGGGVGGGDESGGGGSRDTQSQL